MEAKVVTLLEKVRKGATAQLTGAQLASIFTALGWPVATRKHEGTKAYVITGPDGSTFDLKKEPKYRCITPWDCLRWAKALGLEEAACKALGKPTLAEERTAKDAAARAKRRFEGDLRTCPVCFGDFKTGARGPSKDVMVHHGYQRPGDGAIHGDCFGVGYPAYERSCEGTKAAHTFFTTRRGHLAGALASLQEGPETLVVYEIHRAAKPTVTELVKGTPAYESNRKSRLAEVEMELRQLDKSLALWAEKIARWVLAE